MGQSNRASWKSKIPGADAKCSQINEFRRQFIVYGRSRSAKSANQVQYGKQLDLTPILKKGPTWDSEKNSASKIAVDQSSRVIKVHEQEPGCDINAKT